MRFNTIAAVALSPLLASAASAGVIFSQDF
jgi:hypothetical protein